MLQRLSRIVPLFAEYPLFSYIIMSVHDYFHSVGARLVGITDGYIVPTWLGLRFHYADSSMMQSTLFQDQIIFLSGGLFTALVCFIFWGCFAWQGKWERGNLDEAAVFLCTGIFQLIYGITELLQITYGWSTDWGQLIGTIIAVVVPVLLYGRQLIKWWEEAIPLPIPKLLKKIVTLNRI